MDTTAEDIYFDKDGICNYCTNFLKKQNKTVKDKKNTTYRRRSSVRENGAFINNFALFPSLGHSSQGELTDNKTRKKYDLQ